jgi:outer membrane protein assembly factor BamB
MKRLGGRVTGIRFAGSERRVIAGTSQGFLLCYDPDGNPIWHRLFEQGIRHLAPLGNETLVIDNQGKLSTVFATGNGRTLGRMPGPCSIAETDGAGVLVACGREVWRVEP